MQDTHFALTQVSLAKYKYYRTCRFHAVILLWIFLLLGFNVSFGIAFAICVYNTIFGCRVMRRIQTFLHMHISCSNSVLDLSFSVKIRS